MNNTLMLVAILSVIILVVVGGILAFVFYKRQRTSRLKKDFGQEYDRTVDQTGSQRKAEANLESRQERVDSIQKRELSTDEQRHFLKKWESIQSDFIDDPESAVDESDRLTVEVMLALGFPGADFEQRVEDLSVDYPEMVSHYRDAHSIAVKNRQSDASTEELRKALLDYRTIFNELLDLDTSQELEEKSMSE